MNKQIIDFLNECNIVFDNVEHLNNMEIPRDVLLSPKTYEKVKPKIAYIKKHGFSSSSLTSLQKNAEANQKWPLLNLVRQVLKASNYNMIPVRKANGSTLQGKKKYIRFFRIKKLKNLEK